MVKLACVDPGRLWREIERTVGEQRMNADPTLQAFGTTVAPSMKELKGRVLKPPMVRGLLRDGRALTEGFSAAGPCCNARELTYMHHRPRPASNPPTRPQLEYRGGAKIAPENGGWNVKQTPLLVGSRALKWVRARPRPSRACSSLLRKQTAASRRRHFIGFPLIEQF